MTSLNLLELWKQYDTFCSGSYIKKKLDNREDNISRCTRSYICDYQTKKMEGFHRLPTPDVTYYGNAAATAPKDQSLLELVELKASNSHYSFLLYVAAVNALPDGGHFLECDVNLNAHKVYVLKRTTPGSILANRRMGCKQKRIQLCPVEIFGLSFHLPGPVDPESLLVIFRSTTVMEVRFMKQE